MVRHSLVSGGDEDGMKPGMVEDKTTRPKPGVARVCDVTSCDVTRSVTPTRASGVVACDLDDFHRLEVARLFKRTTISCCRLPAFWIVLRFFFLLSGIFFGVHGPSG